MFEKRWLKEARQKHPGKVIYFPPEVDELARLKDDPATLKLLHRIKKEFGGWIVPSNSPKANAIQKGGADAMNVAEETRGSRPGLSVSEVKIRLVDGGTDGLIGWASCVVNGALYLNNIAIRRTREGSIFLTYPGKRSKRDQNYFFFNPISREAKQTLDTAILGKLQGMGSCEA